MKKLGFMMSLMLGLFVSVCALTACSSDDDDDNSSSNPLVGTWYGENVGVEEDKLAEYAEITIRNDGTCILRAYNSDKTQLTDSDTGTYKVDDNVLFIWWESDRKNWDKYGPFTVTFTISGNTLHLKSTEGWTITLTKK